MANLETTYLGLKLKNPIIAGSSGMTNSVKDIIELEKHGAAAVVLKTIFEEEIVQGMEKLIPGTNNQTHDPMAFDYHYYEVKDKKLSAYLKLIKEAKQSVDIPVIASINCTSSYEWPYFAEKIEEAGADALELNVFSTPVDFNKTCQTAEQLYFDLATRIKKSIKIPVAMKISPFSANLAAFIHRLSTSGIDGIVMFNRFWNPDFDIENFKIIPAGMYSKKDEYLLPLRWSAIMSPRVQCDISATTGVHSGETVIKFLLAGAKTVQVVSALYKKDKSYIAEFLKEVEFWMERHKFKTIDAFRGKMSQAKVDDAALFERVQFMRLFQNVEN